jgi:DNA-binding MarR family transcriptional regulator
MYTATGLCIRDKLQVIHASGFGSITDAQLALFHNLDTQGTRLTILAARAGLTKQSMIELVDKAAVQHLVTRRLDPDDKRAKSVSPTQRGLMLLASLKAGIDAAEQRMADLVGADFLSDLRQELGKYVGNALIDLPEDPPSLRTDIAARGDSTGRILAHAARRFAARTLDIAHQKGHHDVTEVLLALLRNLDLDGTRLTDIAARARMTKQSMRELVDRAEALAYVVRSAHPGDGRAKVITFTPQGLAMLDTMRIGVIAAEQDLEAATSRPFVERLKTGLTAFIQSG